MVLKSGLLVFLGVLWSVRLSAIKAAGISGIPIHVVVSLSALGIALFFSLNALFQRDWPELNRETMKFYGLSAVLGFLAPFTLETAVGPHLPVFVFVVIIATMPLFTFALSTFIGRETVHARSVLAIGLGFAGAVAILWDISFAESVDNVSAFWIAAAFGVPLLYALNTVFVASRWPHGVSPFNVAQAQALIVSLAALLGGVASGAISDWHLVSVDAPSVGLIVLGEGLALVIYLRIARDYGATYVSFANYISIICAALIGVMWFGDRLSPLTIVAALIIIASVALYQHQSRVPMKVVDVDASEGTGNE